MLIRYLAEKMTVNSETITKRAIKKMKSLLDTFFLKKEPVLRKESVCWESFLFSPSKKEVKGEKKRRIEV